MKALWIFILTGLVFLGACKTPVETVISPGAPSDTPPRVEGPGDLQNAMKSIEPFFKPMGPPKPDEWLASFHEDGQTFEQYISGSPTLPTDRRRTIYIQPLGKFNAEQKKILDIAGNYLESFFGLPVRLLETKTFKKPMSWQNYRFNMFLKHKQVRTGYIRDELLLPNLPEDAAAMIAFTNEDLYPDDTMNFVFGEANTANRVGVWSLYWLNDNADFETFLKRTLKIAAHETGHMFSMAHCTKYECAMNGTNNLQETDNRPIDACPECMAKICWMTKSTPQERYERLSDFCLRNGLKNDEAEFRKKAAAVAPN